MKGRDHTPEIAARPTPTACACIMHDGRLLLIERAYEPGQGNWSFSGGRMELGETVLETARREVREETGLDVEPLEIFQVYDWITRDEAGALLFHYVVHYVHARAASRGTWWRGRTPGRRAG